MRLPGLFRAGVRLAASVPQMPALDVLNGVVAFASVYPYGTVLCNFPQVYMLSFEEDSTLRPAQGNVSN